MALEAQDDLPREAPPMLTGDPDRHPAGKPVLQARAVSLSLGGRAVVEQVTVDLRAGQWVAVVGPNGAGKSSLLSMLAGLRQPGDGQVLLHARALDRWRARDRARQIAWLAQQGEAHGEISVRDVVRLGRLPHHGLFGSPDARDDAAIEAAMRETECAAFATRRLNALSGGERQRVLLARALAVQAPVLLLDEPTTHLDLPHQRALLRSVVARAQQGAAVAVVLHDLTLALAADRVWLMQGGRLMLDAAANDPRLHATMIDVFDGAMHIEALEREGRIRHVVRPLL